MLGFFTRVVCYRPLLRAVLSTKLKCCFSSFDTTDYIDIGKKKQVGQLTIIPTPIGNLNDLSIRQYRSLLEADILACEDTRITGMLMQLIKQKKLKQQMEQTFDLNSLPELVSDNQMHNDFTDESAEFNLIDLNAQTDESISNYQRLTREERIAQKIKEIREKAKRLLMEEDTLNIYKEKLDQIKEELNKKRGDEPFFGLEDEFISYLRLRIKQAKKRHGRGIMISYHKFNEDQRIERLIKLLRYGLHLGLVSDAGTPTISDPGHKLVDECMKQDVRVVALPGSSAITTALSLSGFQCDNFVFHGYLHKTQSEKEAVLEQCKGSGKTCVLFENFQRLLKTLLTIEKVYGSKQIIFMAIEMTKLYEKHYKDEVRKIYDEISDPSLTKYSLLKGELTLVIPPFTQEYNKDITEKQVNQYKKF